VAEHVGLEDGVPRAAGGHRPAVGSVLALRRYAPDQSYESIVEHPYEQDPLVAVLASRTDTAADHVRAGQALQRVLLTAVVTGLSVSFVSQPVEVASTRAGLRELLGGRLYPQAGLRLGYGYAVAQTPRRGIDVVTGAKSVGVASP